nr:GNAT family N-acetyltransferase [Sulfitobacter aestuariivivens]
MRLAPIGPADFDRVSHITVSEHQKKFSGTVAEAFEAAEDGVDFHGIFRGQTAVGFFKIDTTYGRKYPFASNGDLGLRAFIIDLVCQGQGIATQAVLALPPYLTTRYLHAKALWLTVNKSNPAAYAAYLGGGFADTGQEWPKGDAGPQNIMRMVLAS